MDSHNCQRVVIDGAVRNEGDVQIRVSAALPGELPQPRPEGGGSARTCSCRSCLSASHIAYGSIRMEPVFMVLGQSAGTAAALAIDGKTSVQKVDYAKLRERLLADKQMLKWEGPPKEKAARCRDSRRPASRWTTPRPRSRANGRRAVPASPSPGTGYLHDGNADKGRKSVKFMPDLPADGAYDVYLLWSRNAEPGHERAGGDRPRRRHGQDHGKPARRAAAG